ncbi:hypothetical protein FSS13T_14220 [Flavobacterium saliperosum S13]|uniref:Outer membrane protein beta-barrel domain-containing protein n=2 Tax=Flavobacterium saliperosum TaxID=329186 RepID=A0A1G4VFY4_9FLAO|nr:hypothetical protein [Flavobacterium saliperosum]ESU25790.1 hypothetical protein FSS13T_14220 [Flavobacterium saliperosum S13]SCX05618.1 hypothetical protein SAMN02927925_00856 [Flavobacterium saliperosum]
MKNKFYFIIFLVVSNFANAQTNFEKGFYINNNNSKVEGFIKNTDWKNNPSSFEFKESENSDAKIVSIDYAKEFEISEICRYVRADIDIEKSSNKLQFIGYDKDPQFTNERLFLKQLVYGSSNLYKFEENGLEKFFYSVNNAPIKQLIFIKYKATSENNQNGKYSSGDVLINDLFRRQLWTDVKCETITQQNIKSTNYTATDLTKYFTKYNACKGDLVSTKIKTKKVMHNLKAAVMYNNSTLSVESYNPSYSTDFKNSGFGFGLEYELILPFNNNKWGITFEPNYTTFKNEQTLPASNMGGSPVIAKTEIKYFQVPLGIRHYFFLNSNSKLFLNAVANVRMIPRKKYLVEYSDRNFYEFAPTSFSAAFGIGYTYKKITGEVRYYPSTNISQHAYIPMNFSNTSFILRYEIFGKK